MAPKLLAVAGTNKSGKTTVAEQIISGLTREGYRTGSIKHVHHPDFTINTKGTDTWRHTNTGSRIVVALPKNETALIIKNELESTLPSILDFMTKEPLDTIVIEGLHSSLGQRTDIFKVVTARDPEDLQERLHNRVPAIVAISGIIAEKGFSLHNNNVPIINATTDSQKLVESIENEMLRK